MWLEEAAQTLKELKELSILVVLQGCHGRSIMEWMCPCKSFYSSEGPQKQLMQNSQGSVSTAEEHASARKQNAPVFVSLAESWTPSSQSVFICLRLNSKPVTHLFSLFWENSALLFTAFRPCRMTDEYKQLCIWAHLLLRDMELLICSNRCGLQHKTGLMSFCLPSSSANWRRGSKVG